MNLLLLERRHNAELDERKEPQTLLMISRLLQLRLMLCWRCLAFSGGHANQCMQKNDVDHAMETPSHDTRCSYGPERKAQS